jgi:serine/threonine protein kinase
VRPSIRASGDWRGEAKGAGVSGNSADDLTIGEVVDGRYRLDRRIGSGGMGVVYQAQHQILDEPVAIKFLNQHLLGSDMAERFFREAKITAKVRHENVVHVLDVGMLRQRPFIVMELLTGETLADAIQRQGPLPISRTLEVLVPAFRGIAAAHERGIIHRDIKPSNIFIAQTPQHSEQPKVVDFGISRIADEGAESLTQTGQIIGTPRYMAPEQLNDAEVDHRADIYAMGVTTYEALCGVPPFAGGNPLQVAVDVISTEPPPLSDLAPESTSAVESVVMKALSKSPDDRFVDANEFIAELQAAAGLEIDESEVRQQSGFARRSTDAPHAEGSSCGVFDRRSPPPAPSPAPRPAAKPAPVVEGPSTGASRPRISRFVGRVRQAFTSTAATGGATGASDFSVMSGGVHTQIGRLEHAPAPSEYFSQLKERAPVTISSWQGDLDAGNSVFFETNNKRLRHLEKMIDFYAKHLDADFEHLTTQMRWTQRLWLFCVLSMFLVMGGAICVALFGELDLESLGVMAMAELLAGFLLKVFQSREEHYRKLRDRKGEHLVYGRRWSLAVQSIDAMPPGDHKAAAIKDLVKVLLREMEPAKIAA